MSSQTAAGGNATPELVQPHPPAHEKTLEGAKHVERVLGSSSNLNLVYDGNDEEPELHARTYFALSAMFLLNLVQVLALQGPPATVCTDRGVNCTAG
jgi:hypothetical protein